MISIISFWLLLAFVYVTESAPFISPMAALTVSMGGAAGMMGAATLHSYNKQGKESRLLEMHSANQGLKSNIAMYADKKDEAEAMKMLTQKSKESPLLAYQVQMAQSQQAEEPQAQALQSNSPIEGEGQSTITFYFGQNCGEGPSVTAYLTDFSDTLADPLRDKVRSIAITNMKAGTEIELYAGAEPTTAKAYSKFIAKNNLPRLQMCNLETSSQSQNHLYVVKPEITPGELKGHVNYLFVKTA